MSSDRGWLKIGELAKKLGVPSTTIRYYTDIGLLTVVAETQGGYRLYDQRDASERLAFAREVLERIEKAGGEGPFTLDEITMRIGRPGGSPIVPVRPRFARAMLLVGWSAALLLTVADLAG